jgi:hypothetical protein
MSLVQDVSLNLRSIAMSRINTPSVASATGVTAEVFAEIKKAAGKVPNTFAAIGALNPQALKAVLAADGALASAPPTARPSSWR